jgi:hypothetical protein
MYEDKQSHTKVTNDKIIDLGKKFSLLWEFSTRSFVMMILLAFAFSHIMTITIEHSLIQMAANELDGHFLQIKKTIENYNNETKEKSSCRSKGLVPVFLSNVLERLHQTDLCLRFTIG